MIPEWLFEKDNYVPKEEKSVYLEKSIFSLIKILSIIRQDKSKGKLLYSVNPTLKVITTLLNIVFISLSRNFIYLLLLDGYVLMSLLLMEKHSRKNILLRSLIFPCITLFALIPSMFYGNVCNSLLIFQKIMTTVLLVNVLSHNTKWSDISKSLKLLFVPDLFIWIMDITIKYIVLLGEYSINLLYALKLRSIGKTLNKYHSITGIMGNLFVKSYKMSEEMSYAMECRGFVGEYTTKVSLTFKKIDYIVIALNIMLISLFIYITY